MKFYLHTCNYDPNWVSQQNIHTPAPRKVKEYIEEQTKW